MMIFSGGCHCGAVRFEVEVNDFVALDCNCSICSKKGFLHVIVPKGAFRLLSDEAALTTYTFGTGTAKHTFCKTCGVHSFYRPRSHPDGIDVNLRCLDGDVRDRFRVEPFDGQNWEDNVAAIQKPRES